jgi:hypothetical protein
MSKDIDKQFVLKRVRELMELHHEKMDAHNPLSSETKSRSEGYLEALYQVENVLINT